jgi:hypothetical protein
MREVLSCDADGCGHVEEIEEITAEHIGMPCPKCGANLLTQEDWEAWQPVRAMMAIMSAAAKSKGDANSQVEVSVGLHNGKTTIEIERPKSK